MVGQKVTVALPLPPFWKTYVPKEAVYDISPIKKYASTTAQNHDLKFYRKKNLSFLKWKDVKLIKEYANAL